MSPLNKRSEGPVAPGRGKPFGNLSGAPEKRSGAPENWSEVEVFELDENLSGPAESFALDEVFSPSASCFSGPPDGFNITPDSSPLEDSLPGDAGFSASVEAL